MPQNAKKMPQRPNGKNPLGRWVGAPQPNANGKLTVCPQPNPTQRKFLKTTPNPTQPNGILDEIYNPGLES